MACRPTLLLLAICAAVAARFAAAVPAVRITAKLKPKGVSKLDKTVKSYGTFEVRLVGNMYMGTVKIKDIVNFTMAHIHMGNKTENGPVVLWAFPRDNTMVAGTPQLSGHFRFPISFSASMLDSQTVDEMGYYFNVHTTKYPGGEIRGQLESNRPPSGQVGIPSPVYPPTYGGGETGPDGETGSDEGGNGMSGQDDMGGMSGDMNGQTGDNNGQQGGNMEGPSGDNNGQGGDMNGQTGDNNGQGGNMNGQGNMGRRLKVNGGKQM